LEEGGRRWKMLSSERVGNGQKVQSSEGDGERMEDKQVRGVGRGWEMQSGERRGEDGRCCQVREGEKMEGVVK